MAERARALRDRTLRIQRSYSQHGEDRWLVDHLNGAVPPGTSYIDVGAHHPTDGSNTYLFYRLGLRGLLIEPNPEFGRILRRTRPGDVLLAVGCGREPAVRRFLRYSAAANSSFSEARVQLNEAKKGLRRVSEDHMPMLPLDTLAEAISSEQILLLSIDVEGLEDEVLDGARETLARTRFVIIEALSTNPGMEQAIAERMSASGFELVHTVAYNRIYANVGMPTLS